MFCLEYYLISPGFFCKFSCVPLYIGAVSLISNNSTTFILALAISGVLGYLISQLTVLLLYIYDWFILRLTIRISKNWSLIKPDGFYYADMQDINTKLKELFSSLSHESKYWTLNLHYISHKNMEDGYRAWAERRYLSLTTNFNAILVLFLVLISFRLLFNIPANPVIVLFYCLGIVILTANSVITIHELHVANIYWFRDFILQTKKGMKDSKIASS